MSRMLDAALVTLVLAASVGYALYSLGPKTLRRWLRTTLADLAGRAPAALHLERIERRLRDPSGGAACGGCDSCAPSSPGGSFSRDGSSGEDARGGAGREIRVPAASIGKRRSN
jgi:hypothetical protein